MHQPTQMDFSAIQTVFEPFDPTSWTSNDRHTHLLLTHPALPYSFRAAELRNNTAWKFSAKLCKAGWTNLGTLPSIHPCPIQTLAHFFGQQAHERLQNIRKTCLSFLLDQHGLDALLGSTWSLWPILGMINGENSVHVLPPFETEGIGVIDPISMHFGLLTDRTFELSVPSSAHKTLRWMHVGAGQLA